MKQAKQKESEPVLYMSIFPNTMVSFDEVAKESKNGIMSYRPEHFKNGRLEIVPDKDYGSRRGMGKDILKRLANHPSNRSNGGTYFWEVDQNALDVMEMQDGKLVAREPAGGITKELNKQLEELYLAIDGYNGDVHELMVEETCLMFDMFSVKGIPKPDKSYDQLRVRARLVDFFAILRERDIWETSKKPEK